MITLHLSEFPGAQLLKRGRRTGERLEPDVYSHADFEREVNGDKLYMLPFINDECVAPQEIIVATVAGKRKL